MISSVLDRVRFKSSCQGSDVQVLSLGAPRNLILLARSMRGSYVLQDMNHSQWTHPPP